MFTKYERMGCMSGEGNRGTTNKAKWRIPFIDTKQRLEATYGREQKKVEKWRQKLLVRFSIDLLSWIGLYLRELPKWNMRRGNFG